MDVARGQGGAEERAVFEVRGWREVEGPEKRPLGAQGRGISEQIEELVVKGLLHKTRSVAPCRAKGAVAGADGARADPWEAVPAPRISQDVGERRAARRRDAEVSGTPAHGARTRMDVDVESRRWRAPTKPRVVHRGDVGVCRAVKPRRFGTVDFHQDCVEIQEHERRECVFDTLGAAAPRGQHGAPRQRLVTRRREGEDRPAPEADPPARGRRGECDAAGARGPRSAPAEGEGTSQGAWSRFQKTGGPRGSGGSPGPEGQVHNPHRIGGEESGEVLFVFVRRTFFIARLRAARAFFLRRTEGFS